jgi:hypothetical protein
MSVWAVETVVSNVELKSPLVLHKLVLVGRLPVDPTLYAPMLIHMGKTSPNTLPTTAIFRMICEN